MMRIILPVLASIGIAIVSPANALEQTAMTASDHAQSASALTLKRVMLSTGGVAYLEHEAEVADDAELGLDVPLDMVDDVLKSIVVYDSKGGVGRATLPGRNPLAQVFEDLPFGADALGSPAALLNALQGAEIKVGSSHPMVGKLLKVVPETVALGDHGTTTRNRVSVLTGAGLQQFMLEEADAVSFVDAELQAKVEKALTDTAAYRAKGRRRITLSTLGSGRRTVRIGYVAAAPLWKASYRLTLPQDPGKSNAQLQGWAVLENMSGQDWQGIELTLLSGRPVSFRQAIYEAYYVSRPEVPVEVAGRLLPRPDTGTLGPVAADKRETGRDAAERQKAAMGAPRAMPLFAPAGAASAALAESAPEPLRSQAVNTAEADAGATQVAFKLPVPVSVISGQSAIVSIIDREVPIQRLALFQPDLGDGHPLAALRVRNDTPAGLPAGVLTLYEQTRDGVAYVGDARLSALPAGETRLVSYAVDEKTKVAREETSASTLTKATIAQGVLTLTRTARQTTVYKIAAPTAESRSLIIEHGKRNGWALVAPSGGAEETASAYRIPVELKAGETRTLTVALETPQFESVRIADLDDRRIAAITATREIDASVSKALAELASLRRTAADKSGAERAIKSELEALTADQARIRENLARIDPNSALKKRYMEKLTAQEERFETLQASATSAADATRAAQAAIDAFIAQLAK
jgi:Domain of unknown function (DUF4139)